METSGPVGGVRRPPPISSPSSARRHPVGMGRRRRRRSTGALDLDDTGALSEVFRSLLHATGGDAVTERQLVCLGAFSEDFRQLDAVLDREDQILRNREKMLLAILRRSSAGAWPQSERVRGEGPPGFEQVAYRDNLSPMRHESGALWMGSRSRQISGRSMSSPHAVTLEELSEEVRRACGVDRGLEACAGESGIDGRIPRPTAPPPRSWSPPPLTRDGDDVADDEEPDTTAVFEGPGFLRVRRLSNVLHPAKSFSSGEESDEGANGPDLRTRRRLTGSRRSAFVPPNDS